ncbi:MAG: hypothetical protein DRJ38_02185 [Thermoprotei archaeon]|nr:MAG: hypothetical protein DRJ38_02185 [Thermoprotei archaeon]
MKKIIGVLIAVLVLSAGLAWAQELFWMEDYDKAVELSEESGKPLFIYFYSETCFFCEKFERETLKDPEVVRLLEENFILLMINARKEIALARAYGIPGTPTVFVRMPDGTVIDYNLWENWHPGFMDAEELEKYLVFSLEYLESKKENKNVQEISASEEVQDRSEMSLLAALPLYL